MRSAAEARTIDQELERTALGQLMIAAALIATETHNRAVGVMPAAAHDRLAMADGVAEGGKAIVAPTAAAATLVRSGSGSRLDYAADQSEHGRPPPPAGSPQ